MSQELESQIDQSLLSPNEQDRPSAKTLVAALAGAGMAISFYAASADNITDWYANAQVESIYADDSNPDFSELGACIQPPAETPRNTVRAAAMRCITYGLQDAELVIVDMTEADDKLQPFAEELEKRTSEATNGYITLDTRITETDFDITTLTKTLNEKTGEQCLSMSNARIGQIIESEPKLQAAPYVVFATDVKPCEKKISGFASGPNGSAVLNFNRNTPNESAWIALHEVGHLVGLKHFSQFVRNSGGLSASYEYFDERDMTSNTLNLLEVMESMTLKEYEGFCTNIMGSLCDTSSGPALSAIQQGAIRWPERALGVEQQDNSVRDITTIETVITSDEAKTVSGFVELSSIYEIVSERGVRNQYDSALIAANTWGMLEDGKPVIRDITMYLANQKTGGIAAVGSFDVEYASTPDWIIELTADQDVNIKIDGDGNLSMKLMDVSDVRK